MKLSALLFVMLLCSLQLVSSAPSAVNLAICCPGVSQMKLPLRRIVSYSWTDSGCSIKAVIFKMVSGKRICMDPASNHVNAYMKAPSLLSSLTPLLCPVVQGPLCPHSLSVCEISHSARTMKLSALLFVMLLCSLQLVSSAPDATNPVDGCCFELSQMKLPLRRIVSYSWTDSKCPIKAVIFKMVSGKQFCMDPASNHVNAYMKAVDQRNYTSAPGNPTSSTH
ncbi:uncharacterized protein LOC143526563 [Brachyhypopomus gauderio]|uniref:uncharacterized protein LOC143526563 n=1 Tax=Brachyhypopomus gauderio TaxID=698409 RepID=UPI004041E167